MKITLTRGTVVNREMQPAGFEAEVDAEQGKYLVSIGKAVESKSKAPEPKAEPEPAPEKAEEATAPAPKKRSTKKK